LCKYLELSYLWKIECWIEYVLNWRYWILNFGFDSSNWILVVQQLFNFGIGQQFWYWATTNSCYHFKKKTATYHCRENRAGMCQFLILLHTVSHFLTRFLKNRGDMLYFPSWFTTALVSSVLFIAITSITVVQLRL